MSYPQPSSDDYAIKGVQFFRLLTPLTSPGDIYESAQSGHAMALGPQSDVANAVVAYFDAQVQTFVNVTAIGPRRTFVGRIDARNDAKYAPSGRPGRILIFPADLFDPSFQPSGFVADSQTLTFVTPILDVIEYFSPQQSLGAYRDDKTYRFEGIPNNGASGWIIIPYWGRKSATIRFTNFTSDNLQTEIRGVNYFIQDGTNAVERTLLSSSPIGSGAARDIVLTSNANTVPASPITIANVGAFDALAIFMQITTQDGATPLEVTVSDDP